MILPRPIDSKKNMVCPGNQDQAIDFCIQKISSLAQDSIKTRGNFSLALCGGQSPKTLYQKLTQSSDIDWSRVILLWSDERNVPLDHKDSNYKMAMDNGFQMTSIPPCNLFPMRTCEDLDLCARNYEATIKALPGQKVDLVLLGVGEDGHTASLFPQTPALNETSRLVVAHFVPQLHQFRLTFTFPCINQARHTLFYAVGKNKQSILKQIFTPNTTSYPAQKIGSNENPSLWVVDQEALPTPLQTH